MPLTIIKPAEDVANVIRGHLEQRAMGGQFRTAQLSTAAPADLSLAAPHPVYNLELTDIDTPNALDKARITAWSYMVLNGEKGIATAEALPSSGKTKPVFASTNEGPGPLSLSVAIDLAEKLPELNEKTYELAVLRVPAVYLTAVWLKGSVAGTSDDLFIPLNPAPAGMTAEKKMTADEFVKILGQLKATRGTSTDNSN